MKKILLNTDVFKNIPEGDVEPLLNLLSAKSKTYNKGEFIFKEGQDSESMGLVLSGRVIIERSDAWGNNSIIGSVNKGSVFGEAYAVIPDEKLKIFAKADEKTEVLFLNVKNAVKKSNDSVPSYNAFLTNLLLISARKNLQLSRRILHTSQKTIRGRLMSYFSGYVKEYGVAFSIPYNRRQLADYLNVDRSAMCNELSKMQKDGLIKYKKNNFNIICDLELYE